MKKIVLLGLLSLSANAFSDSCTVQMVTTNNRLVQTFRAHGIDSCLEAMKECRKSIRVDYSRNREYPNGSLDCVQLGDDRNDNPIPNETPTYEPDAYRMLNSNETAIYNNKYVNVLGMSFGGLYAVKSTDGWNSVYNNIMRESLSVTKGCNLNLCVSESAISVTNSRYVTIAGLSFNDRFVTKSTDGWNSLYSGISRQDLAETKGCISSRYLNLCVGDKVITKFNYTKTVVGIQVDGNVVLRSTDGWNSLSTNVDPTSLTVIY